MKNLKRHFYTIANCKITAAVLVAKRHYEIRFSFFSYPESAKKKKRLYGKLNIIFFIISKFCNG